MKGNSEESDLFDLGVRWRLACYEDLACLLCHHYLGWFCGWFDE